MCDGSHGGCDDGNAMTDDDAMMAHGARATGATVMAMRWQTANGYAVRAGNDRSDKRR